MKPTLPLLFISVLLYSSNLLATTDLKTEGDLDAKGKLEHISNTRAWLALGHYRDIGIFSEHWESEADDDRFFLAADGKHSPLNELKATYHAQFELNDQQTICRFPARYFFLSEQLNLPSENSLAQCEEFHKWDRKLAAKNATLVFPAAYLDSPSSMFGHTLLRLDQDKSIDSTGQLSYTFSFAASMPESGSELAFVYRGLVGGYPGETSTPPYYLKLKEYRDIESRDIWEYTLDFSDVEMKQLMRHLWEIKDLRFDYYFFSENCSYRVMALLQAVRPDSKLLSPDRIYTIPVVTVRDALATGAVKHWQYRPSVRSKLDHDFHQLSATEKLWVENVRDLNLAQLEAALKSDAPTPNTLAVAYQYARMLPNNDLEARQKAFVLLREKSSSSEQETLEPIEKPLKRDDQGHESERLNLALGQLDNTNYLELEIRPAYHELIDPGQGYPQGSELIFGKASARYYEGGDLELEQLSIIEIKSLKAVTPLFNPTSWSVGIGADRDNASDSLRLTPSLSGALGKAFRPFSQALLYGLFGGDLRIDSKLDKHIDVIGQFNAGIVYELGVSRSHLTYTAKESAVYGGKVKQTVKLESALQVSSSIDLSFEVQKSNLGRKELDKKLGVRWFF